MIISVCLTRRMVQYIEAHNKNIMTSKLFSYSILLSSHIVSDSIQNKQKNQRMNKRKETNETKYENGFRQLNGNQEKSLITVFHTPGHK